MGEELELLPGTLDMLILKAVSLGPLHGYGILLRIEQISKKRLDIQQGWLYPALYRMEDQRWISSEWGESENNRKAKFYALTAAGKKRLQGGDGEVEGDGGGNCGDFGQQVGGSMRPSLLGGGRFGEGRGRCLRFLLAKRFLRIDKSQGETSLAATFLPHPYQPV